MQENPKTKHFTEEHKKRISDALRGRKSPWVTVSNKKRLANEENHPKWKGEDAGYGSKHKWVRKHLGKPDTCENCGISGLKGIQIHWANIDHKYKRKLTDWIRLCALCHARYDRLNFGKVNQYVKECV